MGTPEFAVPSLLSLNSSPYRPVAVYTQPDKRVGRGRMVASSPVKEQAITNGIQVTQPENLRDAFVIEQITELAPDLIVVAAYGKIIPPEILSLPEHGCINLHPSILPRYRGASPVAAAILNGDRITGVTIMLLDAGMDSGPVICQKEVTISDEDTTGTLTEKLGHIGAQLMMETIPLWIEGKIKPQPQDDNQATYTRVMTKEDGEIDWHIPALDIWRRVKAFDPWPGCYTRWRGKQLKIKGAVVLQGVSCGQAGRVIALPRSEPTVVGVETGNGVLGLLSIQLEGKREMSAMEFVRGQREFIGSILF